MVPSATRIVLIALCYAVILPLPALRGETREAFYPNQVLKARFQTKKDAKGVSLRHGRFKNFHSNGRLAVSGWYWEGEPSGIWNWWDDQGRLIRRVRRDGRFEELLLGQEFNNSTITFRNTAGVPEAEGLLKNNKAHGLWVYWYRDGTPKAEGNFLNGIPDGKWVTYYPNGQIQKQVEYHLGIPDGLFINAFENGQEAQKGRMSQGLREGVWRFYYLDGRRREEGRFAHDRREGEWRFWAADGALVRHAVFGEGEVVREIPIPHPVPKQEIIPDSDSYLNRPRVFDDSGKAIPFRFSGEKDTIEEGKATTSEEVFDAPWERLGR